MQSQYSTGVGEPAVGKSLDGRLAATMNNQLKAGGPFGNPNALRSPQLNPLNQRNLIRNT